ncbi:MAG: glycosyltransferase family 2 protein, partial [Patescibacteria group bacterium]
MNGISVVINTLNEEENLPRALSSVKDLADEIIVVDAMSKDTTVEVAKEAGAKVYLYKKPVTYVEPARNFAINKATHDWILILDADEKITPQLA